MAIADILFKEQIQEIFDHGYLETGETTRATWADDNTPAKTRKVFALMKRFDLSKEFPILTLRKINYKVALDEILWIYQKKSNNIKDLNSKIWNQWADDNGSIGKAYGYVAAQKHDFPEGEMTQIDKVIYDLKNNPSSRRIRHTLWTPQYIKEKNLVECAHSFTLDVTDGKLNMLLEQRSGDMLTAAGFGGFNTVQYAFLQHMLASVANLEVGEFVHIIANAHIYDRHEEILREMLTLEPLPAPKLKMNKKDNFYDFTVDDFELVDYEYQKTYSFPVAK